MLDAKHRWHDWTEPPEHLTKPEGAFAERGSDVDRRSVGPEQAPPGQSVTDASRGARDFDAAGDPDLAHEAAPRSRRVTSKALRALMRGNAAGGPPLATGGPPSSDPKPQAKQIELGDSTAAKARRLKKRK